MKRMLILLVILTLVFSSVSFATAQEQSNFEIRIDGKILEIPVEMGKAHVDENGRSLVPARAIIEGLGFMIKWEGETQTVKILDQEENQVASLQIGSKVVNLKNSKTIEMDTEAKIEQDGRTYVPLRFVSQALGFEIPKDGGYKFENNTHYINIVSPLHKENVSSKKPKVSNLSDDITYFNETILSKEEYFNFSVGGELNYNNQMALIYRSEKIKIGRTENNQPVVEIGVWKENNSFETLRINLCQEIMKYYAREDVDGNKIFTYVDGVIGKNEKPDASKVLKFGNTTVAFGENEHTKEADMIIKLDSLMFGPKSIDDINKMVDGDVTVIDISKVQVPHYQDRDGGIRIDKVGSVDNSMMGTRPNGSSYEDDMALFNKALDGSTWKITSGGHLQWASMPYEDRNSSFIVERDSKNNPIIMIRTWDNVGDVESYMPCNEGMTMNLFMESVKYYSKSPEDGEAIYWYVDKAFKAHREIATGETYLFGKTKVKITDPGVYGIDVIFVD